MIPGNKFSSQTTGILEYWNDGVMGFGKMGKWVVDKIYSDRVVKKP